jgi:hypothetical protein
MEPGPWRWIRRACVVGIVDLDQIGLTALDLALLAVIGIFSLATLTSSALKAEYILELRGEKMTLLLLPG